MLEDIVHEGAEHMGISCLCLFVNVAPTYCDALYGQSECRCDNKGIVQWPLQGPKNPADREFPSHDQVSEIYLALE
jgi:hypothetical protein